jgi:hypothetical protein
MIVVVGGHSRNVGKTTMMCRIIEALPELGWTAVKISPHRHGAGGATFFTLEEELAPADSDTGRYLAAGAKRSLWLRAQRGRLNEAMPALWGMIDTQYPVIIESNSILTCLQPDLYLSVINRSVGDIKETAQRFFDQVTAFVETGDPMATRAPEWEELPAKALAGRPIFPAAAPHFHSPELIAWLRESIQRLAR